MYGKSTYSARGGSSEQLAETARIRLKICSSKGGAGSSPAVRTIETRSAHVAKQAGANWVRFAMASSCERDSCFPPQVSGRAQRMTFADRTLC
jgi:hypothetical protein